GPARRHAPAAGRPAGDGRWRTDRASAPTPRGGPGPAGLWAVPARPRSLPAGGPGRRSWWGSAAPGPLPRTCAAATPGGTGPPPRSGARGWWWAATRLAGWTPERGRSAAGPPAAPGPVTRRTRAKRTSVPDRTE